MSSPTSPGWEERQAEIARIGAAQHAQVTFAQLRTAGLSATAIRHRARTGRLHRAYPGVYSLGRPPTSPNEHRMAAVLACGNASGLSHVAAAAHCGIRPSAASVIDVVSPTGAGRGLHGIRAHRSRTLAPSDIVLIDGIPTTSCARTLLDLAEVIGPESLAKAVDQAEILGIFDLRDLEDVLERNGGRHGLGPLRALLSSLDPRTKLTRNDFERRFLALCDSAGLPKPEPNAWLRLEGTWIQADFLWPERRLVAETDGFETHGTRQAFERDRHRDQLLLRTGYRTVRFTWRQLRDDPAWVAETVRLALQA